jgi:soluble lytic murein transglycosylase-like protein
MALERVMGIHNAPLSAVSTQGGSAAAGTSASGETSRDKTHARVERFRSLIEQAAQRHRLDAALLAAVVHVESGGNPQAVSPAGAQGLTQLIPATAQRFGVHDPFDPAQSLDGAAKYLQGLLGQFGGDVSKALAAYNAGEGNVKKYGGSLRLPRPRPTSRLSSRPMTRIASSSQPHRAASGTSAKTYSTPRKTLPRSMQEASSLPPPRSSAWHGSWRQRRSDLLAPN